MNGFCKLSLKLHYILIIKSLINLLHGGKAQNPLFMKLKFIGIFLLVLSLIVACSEKELTTKELLDEIHAAAGQADQGNYVFNEIWYKQVKGEDSTGRQTSSTCYFKKVPSDSLIGFQLSAVRKDGYHKIYDGNSLFTVIPWTKTLEVTEKATHVNEIRKIAGDYTLFPWFIYENKLLQFYNKDSLLNKVVFTKTMFHGEEAYKIQTEHIKKAPTSKNSVESYTFVSTKSFLPIGQFTKFITVTGDAKEEQVFDHWITDFKTETVPDSIFKKETLSGYNQEFSFNPERDREPEQLAVGSLAPDWKLPLLSGGELSLHDLKGKIVVLDFWYKACSPCLAQMISLQKLHERYDPGKVIFIGVNTKDDPIADKLEAFLTKRKITISTVYQGSTILDLYHVYAAPALFVIDKNGKIVLSVAGYSDSMAKDISTVVEKNL